MNILLVCFNPVGRGTYWRAYHLARCLSQSDHEVTLMVTSPGRRWGTRVEQREGMLQIETPDLFSGSMRAGYDPWNTLNRLAWLSGRKYDLVHAFESRPGVIYPSLFASRKSPLFIDWADWFGRGGSVEERKNPLVRAGLRPIETYYEEHFRRRAAGHTVISSTLQARAVSLGIPADKILLLPNGVDVERFPELSIEAARRKVGLPAKGFFIGYVGSIFQKDAELMAAAFDRVCALIPDAYLLIAGYCPINIKAMVSQPAAVIQTGSLEDAELGDYLSACDIFWLPLSDILANRGRSPIKQMDYLAVGRPLVATDVGDILGIIKDGSAGVLTQPDPGSIAAATEMLFQQPAKRIEMGAASA